MPACQFDCKPAAVSLLSKVNNIDYNYSFSQMKPETSMRGHSTQSSEGLRPDVEESVRQGDFFNRYFKMISVSFNSGWSEQKK